MPRRLRPLAAQYRRSRPRARLAASDRARSGSGTPPPLGARRRAGTKHPPASAAAGHSDRTQPERTAGSRTERVRGSCISSGFRRGGTRRWNCPGHCLWAAGGLICASAAPAICAGDSALKLPGGHFNARSARPSCTTSRATARDPPKTCALAPTPHLPPCPTHQRLSAPPRGKRAPRGAPADPRTRRRPGPGVHRVVLLVQVKCRATRG